ncbi:hypothetical protein G9U51_01640 [Calidifontibacter sp. DB0510]|uniref:Uncharacterized protein n=1 Tax=Metallococcus carri TaxID=1656884 RepID=A0A967E943_9MICO|nr:hypothetical protein [Metallococcus carri]NHN54484.1 hypothetical protein [Metallococcus carri]NOP36677.1 hypothetical protein [Calidifontibacter sp. DB2511S]
MSVLTVVLVLLVVCGSVYLFGVLLYAVAPYLGAQELDPAQRYAARKAALAAPMWPVTALRENRREREEQRRAAHAQLNESMVQQAERLLAEFAEARRLDGAARAAREEHERLADDR